MWNVYGKPDPSLMCNGMLGGAGRELCVLRLRGALGGIPDRRRGRHPLGVGRAVSGTPAH